jgi:hypothetical protein
VIERIATLEEINTSWTLTDINKANALLDMKADIKAQAIEAANKK